MVDESLITVTNNENPPIELQISSYSNNVDIQITQSNDAALSVHNSDTEAHLVIINPILDDIDDINTELTQLNTTLATKANTTAIPTTTSQLTNNSNFATISQLPNVPTNVSSFTNDSNYVNSTQMTNGLTGRADTNLSNINASTARTNLGFQKYDSGWFAVAVNTTYTKTHNLGTKNIKYDVLIADDVNGTNQRRALDYFVNSTGYGYIPSALTSTTLSFIVAQYVGMNTSAYGITSAYYRILAEVII